LKDLNLKPEQIQQIKAIRSKFKNQMTQTKEAVRQAQQELQVLMADTACFGQKSGFVFQAEAVINIRSPQNRSMEILDPTIRDRVAQIIMELLGNI
jgi:predicted methyltransferase